LADVSEVFTVSTVRVMSVSEVLTASIRIAVMMEAVSTSETSVNF
jgi:hypothetical protein